MGHQASRIQTVIKKRPNRSEWNGTISCKTSFHYIHPIKCEIDEHLPIQQETVAEIEIKTHEAEYWEIQNHEEPSINSVKDLQKIEEIKVRWNEFIKMKKRNYLEDYAVLKQIGRGGFGCVHKVKARYTGLYRAAKRIKKTQLKKSQHEKLFEQMAIMIALDHPNIAKLYEVYDYKSYYVLILELCEGGQLFKKIVTKQLNEQISEKIMKQILWTLIYLHKKGIVHRDLKPENMLFQQNSDMLKIIDFGLAVKKKPGEILTARLGTPYYIAPQVLCKSYAQKCDIWSAGVILFMMISGYPPFRGDSQYEVMESVLKEEVSFKSNIWGTVSSQCKQLIGWMLKKSPQERPSADEAFNHSWIKKVVQKVKPSKQQNVIANIRGFSFQNKLQAVVYTYIVSQLLTSEEKKFIFQTFKELDKNNDGVIESGQLAEALKSKKQLSQERVNFLMRIIDTNGSGHIDYTQFLVAGLDPKNHLTQQHFQQAFQYFDIDHSGAITFEQIAHFLQDTKQSQDSIKKIFQQIDENNDGNISKEEFVQLLMKQTKKKIISSLESLKQIQNQDVKSKLKTNKKEAIKLPEKKATSLQDNTKKNNTHKKATQTSKKEAASKENAVPSNLKKKQASITQQRPKQTLKIQKKQQKIMQRAAQNKQKAVQMKQKVVQKVQKPQNNKISPVLKHEQGQILNGGKQPKHTKKVNLDKVK